MNFLFPPKYVVLSFGDASPRESTTYFIGITITLV
jgi:hypothetical protein